MPLSTITKDNSPKGKLLIWKIPSPWVLSTTNDIVAGTVTLCVDSKIVKDNQECIEFKLLHNNKVITSSARCTLASVNQQAAILDLGPEPLAGMFFVFTGALALNREFYKRLVQGHSGTFQTSVCKTTTHLVTANINSGTTKMKKAKEAGLTVLSEDMFLALINKKL
jgi:NAD-dependent DNA ligase